MLYNTFSDVISCMHDSDNGIVFYERGNKTFTPYKQLYQSIQSCANELRNSGIEEKERVIISLSNDYDHVVGLLSLMHIGAIPLSVKPKTNHDTNYENHILAVANGQNASRTLYFSTVVNGLENLRPNHSKISSISGKSMSYQPNENDIAFIQYSSGSTSDPKPVPITHHALCINIIEILSVDNREKSDWGLNFLPICHDMGLVGGLLSNLYLRNNLIFTDMSNFLRSPIKLLEYAWEKQVKVCAMPDFVLRYLAKVLATTKNKNPILEEIRTIYCGSEPIRKPSIESFITATRPFKFNQRALVFAYGLAETTLIATFYRFTCMEEAFESRDESYIANNGKPVKSIDIKIGDGKNQTYPGKIYLKGACLFKGYDGCANYVDDWFDSGDVGYIYNENLYICGREKELIIINGENFFPTDIESYVRERYQLQECLIYPAANSFDLIVVPDKQHSIDIDEISNCIVQQFGVSPNKSEILMSNQVFRTSSGKPIKHKIFAQIHPSQCD